MTTVNANPANTPVIITDTPTMGEFFGAKLPLLQNVFRGKFPNFQGDEFADVFADGLEKAVRTLQRKLEEGGALSPEECYNWSYTAINSTFLDGYRRRNSEKNGGGTRHDDIDGPIGGAAEGRLLGETIPSPSLLRGREVEDQYRQLAVLLRGLPISSKYAATFWLYAEGYTMEEIAIFTGQPVTSVKPIIHRVKKKIGI